MNIQTESKPILERFTVVKRAIIYSRVSTDDQAETGTSIDNQVENSVAYAAAHNMKVVGIFREDYTGTTLDRPELNKARAMLRTGQADVLIAYKTNRLDRSEWGVNLLALLQELKTLGIELHYSQSGRQINLSNPVEALMQSIEGWQAGEDRNEIVRRLTEGKQYRLKQGSVMVFSRPPYGYKVVKKDKVFRLEIEPDEAEVIRLIFQWYTSGEKGISLTLGSIQKKLNEMAIPTASKTGQRLVATRQDGNKWYRSVINSILQNETYAGTWHYGKRNKDRELIAVSVPAIVDREVFEIAQKRLMLNRQKKGRKPIHEYLMSKRINCRLCNRKASGKTGKDVYYVCPGRRGHSEAGHCTAPYFRADKIDDIVWKWVRGFFDDEDLLKQAIEDYQARQADLVKPLLDEQASISRSIVEIEQELADNQRTMKLLGENPPQRTLAKILTDIKFLEAQLDGLEKLQQEMGKRIEIATTQARNIQAALDWFNQLKADLGEALNLADVTFPDRRFIIERLNVEAILYVENGQKMVETRCYLGEQVFKLSDSY